MIVTLILMIMRKDRSAGRMVIHFLILVSLALTSLSSFFRRTKGKAIRLRTYTCNSSDWNTGNILFSPWHWPDIIKYTDHIMHTTYSHLPIYLIGVLIADLSATQSTQMSKKSQLMLFFAVNAISLLVSAILPFALDYLLIMNSENPENDVLKRLLIAAYIPIRKLTLTSTIACTVYFFSVRGSEVRRLFSEMMSSGSSRIDDKVTLSVDENHNHNNQTEQVSRSQILLHTLSRIAFTVFLVNLFIIRLDFYSARIISSGYPLTIVRRMICLLFYILLSSLLLHLIFIQPLDLVRRKMLGRIFPTAKQDSD